MIRFLIRLTDDRTAVAAVEFALVGLPFIAMMAALLQVASALYTQEALDYATQASARQIQIGAVSTSMSAAAFQSTVFCPKLAALLSCSGLSFDLRPVADYYSDPGVTLGIAPDAAAGTGFGFCPGVPGQLMFLRVIYQAPAFATIWWTGAKNVSSPATRNVQSTAAFAIETTTILSAIPTGGC